MQLIQFVPELLVGLKHRLRLTILMLFAAQPKELVLQLQSVPF